MTKTRIIDQIKAIASEYNPPSANLDWHRTYMNLTKAELEKRLETAQVMIVLHRQAEEIKAMFDDQTWKVFKTFPNQFAGHPIVHNSARRDELTRIAMDLWHQV